MTMTDADTNPLAHFRILGLPEAGYYIPNFISESEEDYIAREISKLSEKKWTVLSRRRLVSIPSQLSGIHRDTLIDAPIPDYLTKPIFDKFSELQVFQQSTHGAPNHCLVNAYEPGQGIMPHVDGPTYAPITATVSLTSHTVLNIYEKNEEGERATSPKWRILQEPRSLLITTNDMYKNTLHGIDEIERDDDLTSETIANWSMLGDQKPFIQGSAERVGTRISLTYRDVLKVRKLGGVAKFMTKK